MMKALLAVLVVAMLSQYAIAETKTFPDLGCSISLPDETWQWESLPNSTAAMSSKAGFVLTLTVKSAPAGFEINDQFPASFEKGAIVHGVTQKRSGTMTKFQGVPCYQLNITRLEDGSTATILAFASHGKFYMLQLLGDKEPVEQNPNVQKILNSFQFTAQPQQRSESAPTSSDNFSQNMGKITALCVIAIIAILAVKRIKRNPNKSDTGDSKTRA